MDLVDGCYQDSLGCNGPMIRYQQITAEGTLLSEWDRFTSEFSLSLEDQALSPMLKGFASERACMISWSNLQFARMTWNFFVGCLTLNSQLSGSCTQTGMPMALTVDCSRLCTPQGHHLVVDLQLAWLMQKQPMCVLL